jgi:CHASE1-domain containing sensor protein
VDTNNTSAVQAQLTRQILDLTGRIQYQLPELYALLDETPAFLYDNQTEIQPRDYRQYLDTISLQFSTIKYFNLVNERNKLNKAFCSEAFPAVELY